MEESICISEYDPMIAEAAINVPDYSYNRFLIIKNQSSIRPIGINDSTRFSYSSSYTTSKLNHHKFWVIANKQNFRSALSESDLANPDNIVGIGCFLREKQDSKYFVFNISGVLFYGPGICPDGGIYVNLNKMGVLRQDLMPEQDYNILKSYLDDIQNVEYWDYKKHA